MNFNSFTLPALLIRDLYKDCLVDADNGKVTEKKPDISDFTLGENLKHVLIVINSPDTDMISDNNLNFLSGILKACKLSIRDVAVFNMARMPAIKYSSLLTKFKPAAVLLFGVAPNQIDLPVNFPEFKILNYSDIQFLISPSLDVLENDKLLKGKLWACLQQIFL